jgi:hypothetical protein
MSAMDKRCILHDIVQAIPEAIDPKPMYSQAEAGIEAACVVAKVLESVGDILATHSNLHPPSTQPFKDALAGIAKATNGFAKRVESLCILNGIVDGASGLDTSSHNPKVPVNVIIVELQQLNQRMATLEGSKTLVNNQRNPAKDTAPTAASYARVARSTPSQPKPTENKGAATRKENSQHEEERIVARFRGNGPAHNVQLPPHTIGEIVNKLLSKNTATGNIRLLYAKWNRVNNLILGFPAGTNMDLVKPLYEALKSALRLPSDTIFLRDIAWSKVMIANVPTSLGPSGGALFSDKELLDEFLLAKPWASEVVITQPPRWAARPEKVQDAGKLFSLFTVVL